MDKIFVLDTNVLLHDPIALSAFKEHRVVIPMTVLEELDTIKDRKDKDVSREARSAIQSIDKLFANVTPKEIQDGVEIPGSNLKGKLGTLSIFPDQIISHDNKAPFLDGTTHQANDNRIINVALHLQASNYGAYVCLVTKDINMRLKAKGSGLENVEDYRRDRVVDDIKHMATGYESVEGDFWSRVDKVKSERDGNSTIHMVERHVLPDAYPTMFICDEGSFVGFVRKVDAEYIHIEQLHRDQLMSQGMWGLKPRNMEQAMAFFLVQHEDVDLTSLTGPAGSGKTLIALAYGLHAIMEEKRYDKLIVARSTPPLTSGLTYLVEKSKSFNHAAVMHVNGIERSRLAAFAEENL